MTLAPVSELKASLSEYLRRVKAGEEVLVTERGLPVARICPIQPCELDDEQRLAALERDGILRRPRGTIPDWVWAERPVAKDPTAGVRAALLEERDAR